MAGEGSRPNSLQVTHLVVHRLLPPVCLQQRLLAVILECAALYKALDTSITAACLAIQVQAVCRKVAQLASAHQHAV